MRDVPRVVRWDLDKTYLHTDFDSIRGLLRAAVETPETKRSVAGAPALIKVMMRERPTLLTIVSGSPEQMRSALESKLRLDGVAWSDFSLKPSLQNIVRLRFRALRDQVGYKLPALLWQRLRVGADSPDETLFGDDAEADAFVYTLYADLLAGRVSNKLLTAVMEHAGTYPDVIAETLRRVQEVPRVDPVRRVFIHLERRSDPAFFRRYGPRVVPVYDYLQSALVLVGDGALSAAGAAEVIAMVARGGERSVAELAASSHDIVTRGHVGPETVRAVAEALAARGGDGLELTPLLEAMQRTPARGAVEPPTAELDYLAALLEDRARWEAAGKAARAKNRAK
ncbi:MAG: hypothetical protein JNK72_03060 [Myxococcales bacterium]|nr:hypothetical protein [Myxococcales bacterium]